MHCGRNNNDPRIILQHYVHAVRAIQGMIDTV